MRASEFAVKALLRGMLIVVPIYLAILLLLKAMGSLLKLVQPVAKLLPDWLPAEQALSLLLVLFVFFIVGVLGLTHIGQSIEKGLEKHVLHRLPGYKTVRSLTERIVGQTDDQGWKPALAEIEEALVPAFIIEELADGRFTVFVPSIPTPLAGAVYVLSPDRVHPVNVPFIEAIKVVSQWGAGCKELVAKMEKPYDARPQSLSGDEEVAPVRYPAVH